MYLCLVYERQANGRQSEDNKELNKESLYSAEHISILKV